MNYLITQQNEEPFFAFHFEIENCFVDGMVVYDLMNNQYYDGSGEWKEILFDHL